ncbi:MAG: hypothetical protein ACKOW9_03910 [Candidatus Paceibacterota bacterium]
MFTPLKNISKFLSALMIVAIVAVYVAPLSAMAASVTSFSVLLSREKASTLSNQTITFTTPTGIASGATVILTYDNSTSIPALLDHTDIDLTDDGVDIALAATPSGVTAGVVRTSATVITFTNGTTAVAAGSVIAIEIGTHATTGATGDQQITNGTAGTSTLSLSGTFGDTGTVAMPIIADDQVVITATVAPTITFTISDNTIGFGALSSAAARWATGDTNGSASDTSAHTLAVATNATGGYTVSYNGPTLTSGANTITVANITDDADGTAGTEQFGLSVATNGNATIASGYAYAGIPDWRWVASTTTNIISETTPTATETFTMRYLSNISGNTEAGSYSTTVTYIATGTY